MRRYFIFLFFFIIQQSVIAQDCTELKNDPEMRQELQDIANSAANRLMRCCSSYGGNNIKAEIVWDKDESGVCQTRISKLSNRITITMKVSWNGSMSGAQYWILGRLIVEGNSGSKSWEKIQDSGGFKSGCSQNCIN